MGKKRKSFYKGEGSAGKRFKESQLQVGQYGFLCTFIRGRDRQAKSELYDLLKTYAASIYGREYANKYGENNSDTDCQESDEDIDVADALQKEVQKLKKERLSEPFKCVDPGVNNTLFFTTDLSKHSQIVYRVFDDIKCGSGPTRSKILLRLLPVFTTCKAVEEKISLAVADALKSFMLQTDALPEHVTYKVVAKVRNNTDSQLSSMRLIELTGQTVKDIQPQWTVDLHDPVAHIFIDILKTVCCVSIVRDYAKYKKFNLVELGVEWSVANHVCDSRVKPSDVNRERPEQSTPTANADGASAVVEDDTTEANNDSTLVDEHSVN